MQTAKNKNNNTGSVLRTFFLIILLNISRYLNSNAILLSNFKYFKINTLSQESDFKLDTLSKL